MITLRWLEVRPVTLRWIGPSAMAPPLRRPDGTAVAAIIGPTGLTGPPGGTEVVATAVGPLSGHRVVRAVEGGTSYASNDQAADADAILGITLEAADSGAPIRIAASGPMTDPSWSFTPGPVFVGVGGLLVQPAPSGAAFIRQIAQALAPDQLLILNRPPIFS